MPGQCFAMWVSWGSRIAYASRACCMASIGVMSPTYSTAAVAHKLGVHKRTLLAWLYKGKLPEPKHQKGAGQDVRIWTECDLERARRHKEVNYCKGRGRKKKPAG